MTAHVLDRILSHVRYAHGCWEFTGARNNAGYGTITTDGRPRLTHRAVYEAVAGPIRAGGHCDHRCRNKACCNPDHIDIVTPRENVQRGASARVQSERGAAQTHCKNGHEFTPANTYKTTARKRDGRTCSHRHCRTCQNEGKRRRRSKP